MFLLCLELFRHRVVFHDWNMPAIHCLVVLIFALASTIHSSSCVICRIWLYILSTTQSFHFIFHTHNEMWMWSTVCRIPVPIRLYHYSHAPSKWVFVYSDRYSKQLNDCNTLCCTVLYSATHNVYKTEPSRLSCWPHASCLTDISPSYFIATV